MERASSVSGTRADTRDPVTWNEAAFREAFARLIEQGVFLEERNYYPRYRSRYRETLKYLWNLPLAAPARIADVGGGQFAVLLRELRGDHTTVLDVSAKYADYLRSIGITHHVCDLLHDEVPLEGLDAVIIAEVVEHLSTPPHLALDKLRRALRPGGYLIVTTPNLFRLRNVVRMLQGRDYTARFHYPERGAPIGHVMEFSREHLAWQIERAGFELERVDHRQFHHYPRSLADRMLYWAGSLLFLRPTWRDHLVAVARRPLSPHN